MIKEEIDKDYFKKKKDIIPSSIFTSPLLKNWGTSPPASREYWCRVPSLEKMQGKTMETFLVPYISY